MVYATARGYNDGLVAADFNRDGKLDLAATEGILPSLVAVFLGNGDGTFQPPQHLPIALFPEDLAVGDFDGDGKLDLLALCYANEGGHSALSLLRGRGDGTFGPQHDFRTGGDFAYSMATGDFNRDGQLDAAIVAGSSVTIVLGNGNGSFQSGIAYRLGVPRASIISADFNQDGFSDLATTGYANGVTVLLNQGDGSFGSPVLYKTPMSSYPAFVQAADVNADGNEDILTADLYDPEFSPGKISLLSGNGDGTFRTHRELDVIGFSPIGPIVADVDDDGKPDLIVAYSQDQRLSTLRAK